MLMTLNGSLLKLALFEEFTILIVSSAYLERFQKNLVRFKALASMSSLQQLNKTFRLYYELRSLFADHFALIQAVYRFNSIKVAKSILAFIFAMLPINLYLLSNLLQGNYGAIWVNLVVTMIVQTIILFTSTIPMIAIYRAIRRPLKLIDKLQIRLEARNGTLVRHKMKTLNFYEYITSSEDMGFTVGPDATVKSFNLVKVRRGVKQIQFWLIILLSPV